MGASDSIEDFIVNVLPRALMNAMENGLQKVENQAKTKCPVDDGILRASITHIIRTDGDDIIGTVGTNVEYAPYVELGTGIHAAGGHGRQTPWTYKTADGKYHRTKGQKPQPFLHPAMDENREAVLESFRRCLDGAD